MKKYLLMMRYDHWIKQLFVFPGIVVALILVDKPPSILVLCTKTIIGLFAICLITSSNYVLNEWLDAKFDKFHPIKRNRVAVINKLDQKFVYLLYFIIFFAGMFFSLFISKIYVLLMLWLWIMGILYNVKPFRLKDIVYVDVYVESVNNIIRFLAGWYIVIVDYYPPISIVLGYWLLGAFLMTMKRFAEYRTINNPQLAQMYRKSFKQYTLQTLITLSFFNAILSVFFIGIFLIKYRIELIIFIPFFVALFCYYAYIAFSDNSVVQSPEKLYKDKKLLLYILFLCIVFLIVMFIDIPALEIFLLDVLIPIR